MYKRFRSIIIKPAILFKLYSLYYLARFITKQQPNITLTLDTQMELVNQDIDLATTPKKVAIIYVCYLLILAVLCIACGVQMFGKFWLVWYYISIYISYTWDILYLTDKEETSFIDSIKSIRE